jgi:hypothetical protein
MLWCEAHLPADAFGESVLNPAILQAGSEVGDVAMGYYGDFAEVLFEADDKQHMIEMTQQLLDAGAPVICEATFAYQGNLCMVDILRVESDGSVHIVEVKSAGDWKKHLEAYLPDMAYQCYVLTKCGLNVLSVSLMHVNTDYVRCGDLDLQEFFTVEDFTEEAGQLLALVV